MACKQAVLAKNLAKNLTKRDIHRPGTENVRKNPAARSFAPLVLRTDSSIISICEVLILAARSI